MVNNIKKIKILSNHLEPYLIIVLIILLVYITSRFFIDYHNIDLSANFQTVECYLNKINLENTTIKITDTGGDFITRPIEDYYIYSMNDIIVTFIFGIVSSLILGILLARRLK